MLRISAGVNPLMETIGGCAVAAVVFYAGWRNLYHGDSPGQFFAFITALLMCADPGRGSRAFNCSSQQPPSAYA